MSTLISAFKILKVYKFKLRYRNEQNHNLFAN